MSKKKLPLSELKKIEELEKKYYKFYLKILRGNKKDIREQVETLCTRIKWAKTKKLEWAKENPIDIGLQELIRGIFYRKTKHKPFMLPMSSDTVFETDDAIIEIDIKTVKKDDNRNDDLDQVPAHPNQISYSGIYKTDGGCKHKGEQDYIFKANLPTKIENKIVFTFFIKFIWFWADAAETKIQIGARDGYSAFTLSSVPNGLLNDQYENLVIDAKTYFYPLDEKPKDLRQKYGYKRKKKKQKEVKDEIKEVKDEIKEQNKKNNKDEVEKLKKKVEKLKKKVEKLKKDIDKITEHIIEARLKFQKENKKSIDTGRIKMTSEKTKPKLTSGWERHTEIFNW